jgi:precorrin-4 methylase
MSSKIEVSRELAERLALPMERTPEYLFDHRDALDELRALLAAPVVERQPVAIVDEGDDGLLIDFIYGEDGNPLRRGDILYTAPPELAVVQATIAKLEAQLQPRTVRDVVSFAYIAEMSPRQISDLLTKQHEEITMLRNVVKEVAEQFDGGPDHPWIPGFNAKKIYNKVMLASVPLRSAQSDEPSE